MENNSEKKPSRKKRIIPLAISMAVCGLLIGVSVYAATAQTSTVKNTITINTSSQARVGVDVKSSFGASDEVLYNNDETAVATVKALTFNDIGTKETNEDEKELNGPDIVFSYENKYTYVAYQIEFSNTAASDITYNIEFQTTAGNEYAFDSQIDVYSGTSSDVTLMKQMTISGDLLANTNETVYIVIAMNTELIDARPVAQSTFNMVITANQKSQK